jgi:hypothetical protein
MRPVFSPGATLNSVQPAKRVGDAAAAVCALAAAVAENDDFSDTNDNTEMANLNDYDISNTWEATVRSSERITPEKTDEVRNLVLSIDRPGFEYWNGQSVGVLIPGPHEFGNKHHLRL